MGTWYKDVKDEIKTILDTLVGSSQPLSVAYERVQTPSSYPAAWMMVNDATQTFFDTANNLDVITIAVIIVNKQFTTDAEQDDFLDAAYTVVNELRKEDNQTLNGQAEIVEVALAGPLQYSTADDEPYVKFSILIQVSKTHSNQ